MYGIHMKSPWTSLSCDPHPKMLIPCFRSTSVLESSMLLNIQQPFSKLENTILIPTSPEKVNSWNAVHITSVALYTHTHTHTLSPAWTLHVLSHAAVLLSDVSDSSIVQTHMIRLFALMENRFHSTVPALLNSCWNLLFLHFQDSLN